MFIENNILAFNLYQFGEVPNDLETYDIIFNPRENDVTYTGALVPIKADERLFRFDLTTLDLPEAMFNCSISRGGALIAEFSCRFTSNISHTYYNSSNSDTTYND